MLISIEGCIGAGKTTVASGLSERRKSRLLLENFGDHPFLKSFYENPSETANETEIAFLLLHFNQLRTWSSSAAKEETIADFHLGKDLLYAELNLTDSRVKSAFQSLYEVFSEKTPSPDLLVFLSSSTELILERIRKRNRKFEVDVDPAYYAKVNEAYEELYVRHSGKKLSIQMEEWNFVEQPSLFQDLGSLIDKELETGY